MTHSGTATDLVGASEVRDLTGWDIRTVHRKAAAGEIPYVQKLPGSRGQYLFDRAAIVDVAEKLAAEADDRARRIREAVAEERAS